MVGRKGQKQDNNNKKNRAIELAVEGKAWSEIAKELEVNNSTVWKWRKDARFQNDLTKMQEAVFAETALNHSTYLKNGMVTLNKICINKNNEFSKDQQLKAAIELVNLTHKNIEAIKIVEQNRNVTEVYMRTVETVDVEATTD